MDNYVELRKSIHFIDRDNKRIIYKDLTNISEQSSEDINKIIEKIFFHENCREYTHQKTSSVIEKIIAIGLKIENWDTHIDTIANKLLDKETLRQQEVKKKNLSSVSKGSLLQVFLSSEDVTGEYYYIVSKITHTKFLNEDDLEVKVGIPEKIKVFKSAVIKLVNCEIDSIKLFDSSKSIKKYWWCDFLELEPVIDDTENTFNVCKDVRSVIVNNTRGADKSNDRKKLLSRFYSYMEYCENFNFTEMMDAIFNNYRKHYSELDVKGINDKIKNKRNNFDNHFQVDVNELRKQTTRKTYEISNSISAKIPNYLATNKEVIYSRVEEDGEKFLHIKLDNEELFNRFKVDDED